MENTIFCRDTLLTKHSLHANLTQVVSVGPDHLQVQFTVEDRGSIEECQLG